MTYYKFLMLSLIFTDKKKCIHIYNCVCACMCIFIDIILLIIFVIYMVVICMVLFWDCRGMV